MKPDIYHIVNIGKGSLNIMAKPVAGEWIDDEFRAIACAGINQIISLLEPQESFSLGLQNEQELTEKNNMSFISFPIPDRGLPKSAQELGRFSKTIYRQITGGINTVIHCRAGIGRSGLVGAAVLFHHNVKPEYAINLISQKRGVDVPDTEEQRDWLISCYREITASNPELK